MPKQLVFKVVDHWPTQPYEAYWDGGGWQVMGGNLCPCVIGGDLEDAQEEAVVEGGPSLTPDDLIRAIAVTAHSDAAVEAVSRSQAAQMIARGGDHE